MKSKAPVSCPCLPLACLACLEACSLPEEDWDLDCGRQIQAAVDRNKMGDTHLTHTEGIIRTFDHQGGAACAHPVFKASGSIPTLMTPRRKATQREKALAGRPKAGLAVGPL